MYAAPSSRAYGTGSGRGGLIGHYGDKILGNVLGRAAISAIAGCGGAIFGGGKCANGALTAAMAHLFNYEGYGRFLLKQAARAIVSVSAAPVALAAGILAATSTPVGDATCTGTGACDSSSEQYVVRAGMASSKNLEAGTANGPNGYGFSVQTAPGLSHSALAAGAPRIERYGKYSYSTIDQLNAIPGVSVSFPTTGAGSNHGTVNIQSPPRSGTFSAISSQFTTVTNPYKK